MVLLNAPATKDKPQASLWTVLTGTTATVSGKEMFFFFVWEHSYQNTQSHSMYWGGYRNSSQKSQIYIYMHGKKALKVSENILFIFECTNALKLSQEAQNKTLTSLVQ